MPTVVFPYTKQGEKNARAAAREYSGRYMSDKKDKGSKGNKSGIGVMIAVGPVTKRRTRSKKKA